MKEMLKKTWVKVIGAILLFLAGIFILGKCEKASAANFTLADGTVSEVKYNDPNQILEKDGYLGMSTLFITKSYDKGFIFTIMSTSGMEISSNCTRENDTFTCLHWTNIPNNSNLVDKDSANYFTINQNNVGLAFSKYTIRKTYQEGVTDGLASGSANYDQGFIDGQNSVDITTDNQNAIDSYISNNNMKTENEYLSYGQEQYQKGVDSVDLAGAREESYNNGWANGYVEGVNSVDKTTDNQAYADQYIIDNNYHTNEEYLAYGNQKYNEGKQDGIASVDITTDNQQAINKYIEDNDYKSYTEYTFYGEEQYLAGIEYSKTIVLEDSKSYTTGYNIGKTDGINSVDITSDNQAYADQYIVDNNYYTIDQVNVEKIRYYNMGQRNILYTIKDYIFMNYDKNYNIEINCEDDECEQLAEKMSDDTHLYGYNSFNITDYITDNNYHSNDDYIMYGQNQYNDGIYYGYNFLNDQVVEWLYNMNYEEAYIYLLNNHVDMSETNINDYAEGFDGINEVNQHTYYDTFEKISNKGYVQAMEDSEAFLGLIPTTLGAVVSNVMPVLTYEVYGISLMNLIGLISIVGIAIIIVKFIVG